MQTIQRQIITALITRMREHGYQPAAVWDGEEYVMADERHVPVEPRMFSIEPTRPAADATFIRPMTHEEALAAIESVDECTLHFTQRNSTDWGTRGVFLCLFNAEDVITDFHAGDQQFESVIDKIYEDYCN